MRIGVAKFIAGLLGIGLFIPGDVSMALQENEMKEIPSYAGFADIQATRNCFIVVGDTQGTSYWEFWRERNDGERKLIVDEITRREPAFVIHLGDLTTRGSSEKHWQEFDDMTKNFARRRSLISQSWEIMSFVAATEKHYRTILSVFPHLHQRRSYSFTWNNVAMVMVDSNFSTLTKQQIEEQSHWYLNELEKFQKNTKIDFIIVCCHEPPFTNSHVVNPNEEVKVTFVEPFFRFQKTRLFFSGHSHSYERFQMESKHFIVSGGGGGPRHKVIIDPRKQRYQELFSGPELRFFHFCEIESGNDTLVFKVLRLESDDTFTIVDPLVISKIRR